MLPLLQKMKMHLCTDPETGCFKMSLFMDACFVANMIIKWINF